MRLQLCNEMKDSDCTWWNIAGIRAFQSASWCRTFKVPHATKFRRNWETAENDTNFRIWIFSYLFHLWVIQLHTGMAIGSVLSGAALILGTKSQIAKISFLSHMADVMSHGHDGHGIWVWHWQDKLRLHKALHRQSRTTPHTAKHWPRHVDGVHGEGMWMLECLPVSTSQRHRNVREIRGIGIFEPIHLTAIAITLP